MLTPAELLRQILLLRDNHFKNQHNLDIYDYQVEVSNRLISALVDNLLLMRDATPEAIENMESIELDIEFARQSGKTTAVVHTIEFIMLFFPSIFDVDIPIGLFAPQKEQAKTDFDRLKNLLQKTQKKLIIVDHDTDKRTKEENNARTVAISNGASCFIAPVTKASLSESKTFKLMIFEEAQDIDDKIMEEDIFPMGAATNAPRCLIGTAGIRVCYFKKRIDNGNALEYDWKRVAADRRKKYQETGNPYHLIYEQFVKNEIAKHPQGEQADAIRRPYGLQWITEIGMFINQDRLFPCRINAWWLNSRNIYDTGNKDFDHYVGIDQAKHVDQMVMKIGRIIHDKLTVVRSFELRGTNYPDQTDMILAVLGGFKVAAIAIDSTGQGDYMPDQIERETPYKVFHTTFTQQSKDLMYKNFDALINTGRFAYYWDPNSQSAGEFEGELLDLEKQYKGTNQYYLSVHHPDKPGAHDDHADATALMVHAYTSYNVGSGIMDYYRNKQPLLTREEQEEAILNGLTR